MDDKQTAAIKISRVIRAKKWKVIRLMTRVWEFPEHIACIKEVSVLKKERGRVKTKWRVELEKVPMVWVEEDELALRQNKILFKAVEGDIRDFQGEWSFRDHPQGTEVTAEVYLKIDIPAIKDFAEDYVKKLLVRNFEAILQGLEDRLISIRYESYKDGSKDKIAGFGVIGHLYNFNHLEKCLKMLNPEYKMPSREFLSSLFFAHPSFKLYDIINFKSKTGETVNGCFIIATFIPDMVDRDQWTVFSKVVRACKLAEKYGVGIVSLGGFTSIVGEKISQEMSSQVDVPVTTGNTFTAAMVIAGISKAARLLGLDIAKAKIAVIGGTGDIGSGCARVLADKCRELIITGRTKSNLKKLEGELKRKRKARVKATTDNKSAVHGADIIIAAASASAAILDIEWFKPGAIICDVGYPKNVSYNFTSREDIFIFSGGLACPPMPFQVPIDTGLPSVNSIYGCFAESIILALEKRYEPYSIGRGNITGEKIEEIRALGEKHGFELADFYWGHRKIDDAMVKKIKEAMNAQRD